MVILQTPNFRYWARQTSAGVSSSLSRVPQDFPRALWGLKMLWRQCTTSVPNGDGWSLNKVLYRISPQTVLSCGYHTQYMYAIVEGFGSHLSFRPSKAWLLGSRLSFRPSKACPAYSDLSQNLHTLESKLVWGATIGQSISGMNSWRVLCQPDYMTSRISRNTRRCVHFESDLRGPRNGILG